MLGKSLRAESHQKHSACSQSIPLDAMFLRIPCMEITKQKLFSWKRLLCRRNRHRVNIMMHNNYCTGNQGTMNIKATSLIYFQNVVVKNYGLQVQTPFWISTKLNLADIQNYCHSVLVLDKLLINGNSIILNGSTGFQGEGGGTNERHSAGFCQTQSLSFPAKNLVLNSFFNTDAKRQKVKFLIICR